jgi:hypothetical protein
MNFRGRNRKIKTTVVRMIFNMPTFAVGTPRSQVQDRYRYAYLSGKYCDVSTSTFPTWSKNEVFLCLIQHHAEKTYVGVEILLHGMLTSILNGDECLAPRSSLLTTCRRALVSFPQSLLGPRARPGTVESRTMSRASSSLSLLSLRP